MEFVDGVYPHPPWRMHGDAYFTPVLVDTRAVTLPSGFEFVHPGRYTIGTVGFVRYRAPSPLVYDELIYMPGFVRAKGFGPRAGEAPSRLAAYSTKTSPPAGSSSQRL